MPNIVLLVSLTIVHALLAHFLILEDHMAEGLGLAFVAGAFAGLAVAEILRAIRLRRKIQQSGIARLNRLTRV